MCDIQYALVWFSVSSWYILSGVLSVFLLSLDVMFETKLHMSLFYASCREKQSHWAVVTDWVTKLCFHLIGHRGLYVPQGFIRMSCNWHVLGHNCNNRLAYSAVQCSFLRLCRVDYPSYFVVWHSTKYIGWTVVAPSGLYTKVAVIFPLSQKFVQLLFCS